MRVHLRQQGYNPALPETSGLVSLKTATLPAYYLISGFVFLIPEQH